MTVLRFPLTILLPFGILLLYCGKSSSTSSNSSATTPSTNLSSVSVRAVPSNASRAHYYIYDKPEPTPTHIEWYTSTSVAQTAGGGWSASSTTDYGWTTISPTNAGWPSSTTTDYGGWATATPSPPGWSPAPPPPPPSNGWTSPTPAPPPPNNGWASPTPAPSPPNNGWAAPTPAPPPLPPPSNGWSSPPPPPPSNPGWPAPTPPPNNGWGAPPPPTPAPGGWSPAPPSTSVSGWSPPSPGWAAPGGCSTLDCVYLENYIISNILNSSSYHKELRPPPYDTPTMVSVDVFIKNILSIDDTTKMWKAQLTLRQQWNDPRLAYSTQGCSSYKQFTLTNTDSIWTPDLFFPLEEEASYHNVPQRNILVWIAPNGDVTYSTRITLTMNCRGRKTETELICPLIIGSYAYSSDKMMLQWLAPDPVQIDLDRIDLPNYAVGKVATNGNGDPSAYLGQFPGVVAKFTFVKKQNQCRFG